MGLFTSMFSDHIGVMRVGYSQVKHHEGHLVLTLGLGYSHLYCHMSAHHYHFHVSRKTLYICIPTSVSKPKIQTKKLRVFTSKKFVYSISFSKKNNYSLLAK